MFLFNSANAVRPTTPVPAFILTDTSSTIDKGDVPGTPLTKSLDKRLQSLQNQVGESHPDVVKALTALGDACMTNGDNDEALRYYTQALEVSKEAFNSEFHPTVADTLCSIGCASMKQGMYQESKTNFKAALDLYRKASADRSWQTSGDGPSKKIDYDLQHSISCTRASLGSIEFQQKNYSSALEQFNDALLDAKRAAVTAVALDRAHPTKGSPILKEARIFVSDMFSNIASVSAETGDKSVAIENYNKALGLQIQELGEDHQSVACTLHNIGTMHYRSGEYQFALKSYKQVLKMRRFLFGNSDIRIADCLVTIATVHEKANEIERCASALNAALRITAKHYGENSLKCANINENLGSLYARNQCDELALEHYDAALSLYSKAGIPDSHPSIVSINDAKNYVMSDQQSDDSKSGFISATEAWSNLLNNSCGAFCLTQDSNTSSWNDSSTSVFDAEQSLKNPSSAPAVAV